MSDAPISVGYILLSRTIVESEIFKKPPLYLKVWIYLLAKAQHKPYKGLEKGELFTSIPEIQEACSYMVGYRKERPTKDQIFKILEWLRKGCEGGSDSDERTTMIATTKATHGLVVSIDKYSFYQDPKNYEGNSESNNEKATKELREQRHANNINKNDKNDKNDNINTYVIISELYNSICISYPRLTKLSDARKRAINARLKKYEVDDFKNLFELAESSEFLKGANNRNWSATFDWLINDTNMAKVLDGNYNKEKEKSNGVKPVPREPNLSYAEQLLASGYIPKDHGENPFG